MTKRRNILDIIKLLVDACKSKDITVIDFLKKYNINSTTFHNAIRQHNEYAVYYSKIGGNPILQVCIRRMTIDGKRQNIISFKEFNPDEYGITEDSIESSEVKENENK